MGGPESIPTHEAEQQKQKSTERWCIGDGRRENRISMLSPAAARQLQEMSISVASEAETNWIKLLTVYCQD